MKKYLLTLMCVVFVSQSFAAFYMETNQISKEEFELIKKQAKNFGINADNEVVQIISWRNGKLFDDDYNKYADIAYSVHQLGLNFKSQFYLHCLGMKKLPWECKKHEHTTISLNTNDKKDIEIKMRKGQTVDEFLALSVYASEQKPMQWDAKMVTIESKEDKLFEVSYKKTGEECYYHQSIKRFNTDGVISYQVDVSDFANFMGCEPDRYGYNTLYNEYIIYQKQE